MTGLLAKTGQGVEVGRTWWAFNALGLYVLLMYGITYYALSTAAPRIAAEFAISISTIFAMFSAALLATAVLAPRYGRWTDRFGAARVLLVAAILRALALALVALAPSVWWFAAAFMTVQLLSQVTEYDATFAAAVEIGGDDARSGMSQITLWGGLASTAFWPATAFLLEQTDWRAVMLIYAATMLTVCGSVAALLSAIPRRAHQADSDIAVGVDAASPDAPAPVLDSHFFLLAAAFSCGGVAYNLPVLFLPVLEGLGLGAIAVAAGMLFGPSQTAGRLVEMLFGQRTHALRVAIFASGIVALSLGILFVGGGAWTALVFAAVFGAGVGVTGVVRGSVVLALYGSAHYATWLGRLGSIRLVVSAVSPFLLSVILEQHGAWSVVAVCCLAATLSLILFVWLESTRRSAGPA